mmetsp:Transcript_135874/g.433689  ORF Transcript_135874/g.433689 Transcript_135874/m.433689 type:complete len:305 (-) Transcript_135874:452-1366(-)
MADDDGYFKEEFGRRTIEISGLRGDLEDAKDRVTDAHDRTETLHQHIAKLHTEISFRQVKTAELEGSVISGRNRDAAAARQLDADRAACAAEVARLKQGVAESQDAQRVAEVEGQDARSRAELLDSECGAVRARLEALRREAERVREELIRDEAAEEARQVRLGTQAREQGTQRVAEAKDAMEGDMAEVAAARAQVERLEKGLALEKECAAGLNTALQHTLEKKRPVREGVRGIAERGGGPRVAQVRGGLAGRLAGGQVEVSAAHPGGEWHQAGSPDADADPPGCPRRDEEDVCRPRGAEEGAT